MLGLPKACLVSKALPKKRIYDLFKPTPTERRLFDEEINRLSIIGELSSQTMPMHSGKDEDAIFVILVILKTPKCHPKNIAFLTKLIDQRMVFVLKHGEQAALAVSHNGRVHMTEYRTLEEWTLDLVGMSLDSIWEQFIAQIVGVELSPGKNLDQVIAESDYLLKLQKDIELTEQKLRKERQPRKKWDLNQRLKQLRAEYEGVQNDY